MIAEHAGRRPAAGSGQGVGPADDGLGALPSAVLAPVPARLDLRKTAHRDYAEHVVARAQALPEEERAILEAVFDDGMTISRLAALRGVSPRPLRRRIRLLLGRVLSERYAFVVRERSIWPDRRRRVATAVYLHGLSMRDAARGLGTTLHAVRTELQKVDALYESECGAGA